MHVSCEMNASIATTYKLVCVVIGRYWRASCAVDAFEGAYYLLIELFLIVAHLLQSVDLATLLLVDYIVKL